MTKKMFNITLVACTCFSQLCSGQLYTWNHVGPSPILYPTYGSVSGRIWSMAIAPAHSSNAPIPATLYIGTDGGGIWRSRDFTLASPTWQPLTDMLPGTGVIKSITIDPTNPNRLLAPYGDPAVGILESKDNGDTWNLLQNNVQFKGEWPLGKLIVDPNDISGNTMYLAGGNAGMNKTMNGGIDWTPRINGFPSDFRIRDMDYTISFSNQLTLFASVGYSSVSNNGIWLSSDTGKTWTRTAMQLFDIETGKTIGDTAIGDITFASNHIKGSPIYALVANKKSSRILNVFRFTNNTWQTVGTGIKQATDINSEHGLVASSSFQASGLSESGVIYVAAGDVQYSPVYQSTNNGTNWSAVENSTTGFRPHTDISCFAFHAGKVYIGTDGGIYRFNPRAGNAAGKNIWESLNTASLQTILVNGVGLHPTNPAIMLLGSHDNTIALTSGGTWSVAEGEGLGDNSKTVFDPVNGQSAYTTGVSHYDFFFRSDNGGKTWINKSPTDAKAVGAGIEWYAPFAIHPFNTSRIIVGIDRIYETLNRGDTWGTAKSHVFKPSSPGAGNGSQSTAITFATDDIIWVAYGDSVFKTINGGGNGSAGNWSNMNNGTNFGGTIIKIAIDPFKPSRVFMATHNGNVWTNKFNTVTFTWYWDNIKSNLPQELQINTLNLIPVSGTSRKVLLLGTSRGVYLSLDEGYSWGTFNVNLPVQNVKDIQYAPQTKVLIAGIFGRGVFKTSLDKLVTPSTAPSVEVILPKDPNCDLLLPTEGGTATLSYKVNDQLDNSGIKKVTWSVEGASPSPGETSDKNKFTVSIPNPADEVTVFVEIEFNNGIKISGLKKFNTITQEDARLRGIVCELKKERLKPKPWWEWDPAKWRWDPKRNMVIRIPYTRAELIQIEKQSQLFLQQLREQIKTFR